MMNTFTFNEINTIEYDCDLEGCNRITLLGKLSYYPKEHYIFQTNLEDKNFIENNNIIGAHSRIVFVSNKLLNKESGKDERLINSNGVLFCNSMLENWNEIHPSKKRKFTIQDLKITMSALIYMSDAALDELCTTTQRTRNISYVDVDIYNTYQTKDGTFDVFFDEPLKLKIGGLDDDKISNLENPTLEESGQLLVKTFNLKISLKNN
mgnify:CR=1 FL=1